MKNKLTPIFLLGLCLLQWSNCSSKQSSNPQVFQNYYTDDKICSLILSSVYRDDLCWKDELSFVDQDRLLTDLNKPKVDGVFSQMLIASWVHRFDLFQELDSLDQWHEKISYVAKTGDLTDKAFDEYLLSTIDTSKLSKNITQPITHYYYEGDDVLKALVIRQCRLIRKGQKANITIDPALLTDHEKQLLEYSQYPAPLAVDQLLATVSKEKQGQTDIYETLRSYGMTATERIFKKVMDVEAWEQISKRGQQVLLMHLTDRFHLDLSGHAKTDLIDFLNQKKVYNGILKELEQSINLINLCASHEPSDANKRVLHLY